ncbi:MAG: UvrD-helicase domain-containing protein, partial [Desulfofustis sp.]|nr:UvrD-helicase domain-containing protein [Desulfofustis sp.]
DEVLREWASRIEDQETAKKRIDLALLDIDAVSIHTIHSFCQRVLTEQVLESGHLFDMELVADTSLLRIELLQDFWRSTLYNIDRRYGSIIVGRYPELKSLGSSVVGADTGLTHLLPDAVPFTEACRAFDQARDLLQSWWREQGELLGKDLKEAVSSGYFKKEVSSGYAQWLDTINTCFVQGASPDPAIIARLRIENLVEAINKNRIRSADERQALVEGWALPRGVGTEYESAAEQLILSLRVDLARHLGSELTRRLHQRAKVSFDRLILDLATALDLRDGARLAGEVGGRYTVALIDEFQDTDAAQYAIFSRIFGQGAHHLYLIGDPKQAIYRFRGADIYSYLEARSRVDRLLTLDCNYRSTPGLVQAVNSLFDGHEIGGSAYRPVRSPQESSGAHLSRAGLEQPGLIYCQLARKDDQEGWSKTEAEEPVMSWVVREVLRLIGPGGGYSIGPSGGDKKDQGRPVRPGDIGILVRTNRQAERFAVEFGRCNIPVVLSSRRPVFETRESRELLVLLQGVADPADPVLLRTAISSDWFGLDGNRFHRVSSDDSLLDQYRQRFLDYRQCWQESGLLVMMTRLLENERVFLNLSSRPQAERRITNIQHLVELIQQQGNEQRLSVAQTLARLQQNLTEPSGIREDELRLESDRDAVNVVTMHSAKGLEYEIVFCPYLYYSSSRPVDRQVVTCHDPALGRVCDLGSEHFAEHQLLSAQEEDEEDMRLAYVAVTRARLRCYVVWAHIRKYGSSRSSFAVSLGRLLFADGECSFEQQRRRLRNYGTREHCGYQSVPADSPGPMPWYPRQTDTLELRAKIYERKRLLTDRIRTSFSGLTALSHPFLDTESKAADETGLQPATTRDDPFPGGVRFGNLVHEALETFGFDQLARGGVGVDDLVPLISRYRLDIEPEALAGLLVDTVTTPLQAGSGYGSGFSLADIGPDRQLREMEFTLHVDRIDTRDINRILQHEETVSGLHRRRLEGYLSGFIDLVFQHHGRYYIVDYKSNYLGPGASYREPDLLAAMRSHNYGLQYWIYTLALHRRLQHVHGEYRYQEHFGGVMYLFVRGMDPGRPASGVFFARPDESAVNELDACFGRGQGD